MISIKSVFLLISVIVFVKVYPGNSNYVDKNQLSFQDYVAKFEKSYASEADRRRALKNYDYNVRRINRHNAYYDRGTYTYKLAPSPFSDMRLADYNAIFKEAIATPNIRGSEWPVVDPASSEYDPRKDGYKFNVEYQGNKCNSGWAYAAAKAIEILQAPQQGQFEPASLSAQNLIDCAGRATACTTQVPHTAFDFVTRYNQSLHLESDYENNITATGQQFCLTPPGDTIVTKLAEFSVIDDGKDETMKNFVSAGFPVVVEINPTSFEFMHYSEGVFQQPSTRRGSHFVTVIGYGEDSRTGLDYWLVQNSFNSTWGEEGLIRIKRSQAKPLAKKAIFPTEIVGLVKRKLK